MFPSLSIVIPSNNRPDLLRACLASVLCHAPDGTEIIVVDDGSLREIISSVTASFANVHTIRLPKSRGFCAAANAGIASAHGQVLELLNDDTEVTDGWAEAALVCFRDSKVAAVAPLVLFHNTNVVDSAGDRYYLGGVAGKRGHLQPFGPSHLRPCPVFGASASSAFFRRDALLKVGAFPESFGAYFEDVDLAFRLHWAGYEVFFEPASRVYHHVSSSHGRPERRLLERQSLNEERVFWRNLPDRDLIRALPRHFAVLAGKAWRRWQEGNLSPFAWGRLRLLCEVRSLIQYRRRLRRTHPIRRMGAWEVDERFWASDAGRSENTHPARPIADTG